jgi:DNA-binding CsgD family transcriptional regulator
MAKTKAKSRAARATRTSTRTRTAKKRRAARGRAAASNGSKLLTLTEVAKIAGVSIPTAQAYKRKYQDRLPSTGNGRKQRYRPEAVDVFRQLREENRARRGGGGGTGLGLSLAEIGRRTKISYPTLLRYLKVHSSAIPAIGRGRTRRFPDEAVDVFARLRRESRKGRRPKSETGIGGARMAQGADRALSDRIRRLEGMQSEISRQIDEVVRLLKQPLQVTIRPQ